MDTPATATRLDPRDYLARIGFTTPEHMDFQWPSSILLQALHEAHMLAVPFENLSIHYGQPIVLQVAALYDKIVLRRRGGFCYELNGMFAWLLRQLEYRVTMLSVEVAESGGNFSPAYDHLALLVHDVDGTDRLADVGFGDSFRQPLRLRADLEQDGGDGHTYRLRHDPGDGSWVVQRDGEEADWKSQYRFILRARDLADFVDRCHFQQTSPDSHFTQNRICSLATPEGRVTLSGLRLITTLRGVREERELASEDEYRAVLSDRCGVTL